MRIVVTGASGQLGSYVLDRLARSDHDVVGWSGSTAGDRRRIPIRPVDLREPAAIAAAIGRDAPDAILHLAAISRIDQAFREPALAHRVNVEATGSLADLAARRGAHFVGASTDLVFGGDQAWSTENDEPEPRSTYGWTKREGELRVLAHAGQLIARLALLYGPSRCGRPTFYDAIAGAVRSGQQRFLFADEYRTPLDYDTAAEILIRLLEAPSIGGVVHVAGAVRLSRLDLYRRLARPGGFDPGMLLGNRMADVPSDEPRAADASLDTSRLAALLPDLERPTIEEGLRRCLPSDG